MAHRSRQGGDDYDKQPGTCEQTGNNAPQYSWQETPEGRVAKVAGLCAAYHLGHDDDLMGRARDFPPAAELHRVWLPLMPWFPEHYDQTRAALAAERGYTGALQPFNSEDIWNRVYYMYTLPGRRGHDQRARLYGISHEHPFSIEQAKPGKLREVWVRCSLILDERLVRGTGVTVAEALDWGAVLVPQPSLL